MTFRVSISPSALSDIEEVIVWIKEYSPERADAWYTALLEAIFSLEQFPARCSFAPENKDIEGEIRQLLYKRHRIVFSIAENEVRIFRVRHSSQDKLSLEDFI